MKGGSKEEGSKKIEVFNSSGTKVEKQKNGSSDLVKTPGNSSIFKQVNKGEFRYLKEEVDMQAGSWLGYVRMYVKN